MFDLQTNRRDDTFIHHGGAPGAQAAAEAYVAKGMSKSKIVVGMPLFGKVFQSAGSCNATDAAGLQGCKLAVMEDPQTGEDKGNSAQLRFNKDGNSATVQSTWYGDFEKLLADEDKYLDNEAHANAALVGNNIYSWQGKTAMADTCKQLMSGGYKGGFIYAAGQVRSKVARLRADR